MLKQFLILVALSIVITITMNYAQYGIQLLVNAHDWVAEVLTAVFSVGQAGNIARGLIALLAIPVFIGLIPAGVYWGLRRHWFPYFIEVVWVVWLIQAGALLILAKAV